ncbi:Bidirectional sugar transporter SWEET6b [Arachis hypogaea]|nr:Bidirectional sugar transporter SWEET6b [Arachis hypogaea]
MANVIKMKSVEFMPFWLSVANFLNGVCWTTYALIHLFDLYVLISNSIGAISGLVQLILYACYCSCKGDKNNDESAFGTKPEVAIQLSATSNARVAV